jgi:hypothetical protein
VAGALLVPRKLRPPCAQTVVLYGVPYRLPKFDNLCWWVGQTTPKLNWPKHRPAANQALAPNVPPPVSLFGRSMLLLLGLLLLPPGDPEALWFCLWASQKGRPPSAVRGPLAPLQWRGRCRGFMTRPVACQLSVCVRVPEGWARGSFAEAFVHPVPPWSAVLSVCQSIHAEINLAATGNCCISGGGSLTGGLGILSMCYRIAII